MAAYRDALPQLDGDLFLACTGMETDLLFTQELDLPGFASYPLLETEDGRARLAGYFRDMIAVGRAHGDPAELGQQLADIRRRFAQINILGGCCGTDMRHISEIAQAAGKG